MKPIIKSIFSPDLDRPSLPMNSADCSVLVEVEIGPEDEEGADIFDFQVVTPSMLSGMLPCWGRGLLVIDEFSWSQVESCLEKLLIHCEGSTWEDISSNLNKELHWEFENYKESARDA
jgi:hypothetical protein